ncbi:glycoside hydrolase family 3 C-terminal domain-containing protein [Victivallis sp. Marseille-Q1083]|uniref:glycoside hydrolase family 3 C-terminal domain-containing protein n=1 Tax=Victivallis sp. Marseille-Q1083 TaxID=2717288 RepID=UPI001588FDE8|nr:glycoside hydrolase family 3 C-terminal domain-containing protein [Victivallis sp. Marseille-Q1083]
MRRICGAMVILTFCRASFELAAEPYPGNEQFSRRAAAEGMVLLKNENRALPLQEGDRVAIFGSGQVDFVRGGLGSGDVTVAYATNLLQAAFAARAEGRLQLDTALAQWYLANPAVELTDGQLAEVRQRSDVALFVLSRNSHEGDDRSPGEGDYQLAPAERRLLERLAKAGFRKVIAVLNVGGIVDTNWIDEYRIDAVLFAGLPGMEGGPAVMDVLLGLVNPSGKLTDSWAVSLAAYPGADGFAASDDHVDYTEDIFVGYRYFATFDPARRLIRYPFGHGLSYTEFVLDDWSAAEEDGAIAVEVTVRNCGGLPGREVVQLYFAAPSGRLGRPALELAAFAKTKLLAPGEAEKIPLRFPVAQMAAYDDQGHSGHRHCRLLEAGDYRIYLGSSSWDAAARQIYCHRRESLAVTEQLTGYLAPKELPERLLADGTMEQLPVQPPPPPPCLPVRPDDCTRVEAEDYAALTGGSWLEYFYRPSGESGCCVAGWPDAGRKMIYRLEVAEGGRYLLRLRGANGNAEPIADALEIAVNGRLQNVTVASPATPGQWHEFIDLEPVEIELPAGRVELQLTTKGYCPNLDYFLIAPTAYREKLLACAGWPVAASGVRRQAQERGGRPVMFAELRQKPELLDEFVAQLSDEDLIWLVGGHEPNVWGGTGTIGGLEAFGVPALETFDGPAGVRLGRGLTTTQWPNSTLLASSWDVALVEAVGAAVAKEAKYNGVDLWLAPGMNIHRFPLCGRNFEYYSEDPLLTGKIAAAMVRGVQRHGIGVTLKHLAANNREKNRLRADSRLSGRAAREIYLRGFEIAVKEAEPWCIMSSYNLLNGVETAENDELLTGILRGEWDFTGVVMTDWGNNSRHDREIKAGNDIKMPAGVPDCLRAALAEGRLARPELERSAKRILTLILKTGKE